MTGIPLRTKDHIKCALAHHGVTGPQVAVGEPASTCGDSANLLNKKQQMVNKLCVSSSGHRGLSYYETLRKASNLTQESLDG
jgi:hypothetical protein